MPAELMSDPINPNLYDDFSRVAQKIGVYTAVDYANIIGARLSVQQQRLQPARWRRAAAARRARAEE